MPRGTVCGSQWRYALGPGTAELRLGRPARTPRPSRSGAGGAPPGRAGSNQTWPRGQLTRAAGVGPVRPVWAQALPMRHRMRGVTGPEPESGVGGAGPPRRAQHAAQGPPRRLRGPRPPPHSARLGGGAGAGACANLACKEAGGWSDCSPQKPPRSKVLPKPRLGVSGPLPARTGLGPPGRCASGPGRGLEWGRRGLSRAAAPVRPPALAWTRLPPFPRFPRPGPLAAPPWGTCSREQLSHPSGG